MDAKAASNWYRWLWFSPLLTIPTLVLVYLSSYEEILAVLVSAGWHLILLIPVTNKKDRFVSWHGRQAMMLAGLRTLIVLLFYEVLMDNPIVVIVYNITEPVLAPLRRITPRLGMIDVTPMLAIILLYLIVQILHSVLG